MSSATWHVGDALTVLRTLPDDSADLCLTSPAFLALRSYLAADDPMKHLEMGSEPTPGAFLDALLDVVVELRRVLAPHGSLCVELGDTYSGSGGAGGDYTNEGGFHEGQNTFRQQRGDGWPLPKSLTMVPQSFAWALAYGRNPWTGRELEPWRVRNIVRWCRPNPPVGALGDKFRPATSEMVVACVGGSRYFDLDAVREPGNPEAVGNQRSASSKSGATLNSGKGGSLGAYTAEMHAAGAPPLDYWVIPTHPYPGSHYATFPPELCVRPIKAMCPERVCRVCGKPSERITGFDQSQKPRLAAHIKERREACGFGRRELAHLFPHYKNEASITAQFSNWERGANVPSAVDWSILAAHLGVSDEFAELIERYSAVTYETHGRRNPDERRLREADALTNPSAQGMEHGRATKHVETVGWTDCGCGSPELGFCDPEDQWRRGVVLDPFAGSGTTLEVATGHGRDAIGIDLDPRNLELARQRIGLFLTEAAA